MQKRSLGIAASVLCSNSKHCFVGLLQGLIGPAVNRTVSNPFHSNTNDRGAQSRHSSRQSNGRRPIPPLPVLLPLRGPAGSKYFFAGLALPPKNSLNLSMSSKILCKCETTFSKFHLSGGF